MICRNLLRYPASLTAQQPLTPSHTRTLRQAAPVLPSQSCLPTAKEGRVATSLKLPTQHVLLVLT